MNKLQIMQLYNERFSEAEITEKNKIWEVLCRIFFSKYISSDSIVVDIGAGYCEFLNNITARKKIAIDINPATKKYAKDDIEVFDIDCRDMVSIHDNSVDIVFISNFLEHLQNKDDVFLTLMESFRILKRTGLIIIMGPNIRYLFSKYWDFFDHKVPLSHNSLIEVLQTIGFSIKKVYNKFLPYTTKDRIIKHAIFIHLYLIMPIFYKILGKQFLIVGEKK